MTIYVVHRTFTVPSQLGGAMQQDQREEVEAEMFDVEVIPGTPLQMARFYNGRDLVAVFVGFNDIQPKAAESTAGYA